MKYDMYRYRFMENDIDIKGEKHNLIALAKALREAEVEGTLSDLAYQIEYEFDIDGARSENEECPLGGDITDDWSGCAYSCDYHYKNGECVKRDGYVPSAENGDYGPSNPWDAPGMSIHDFI